MGRWAPLTAIVWAQWRTSRNFFSQANKRRVAVRWLLGMMWYGAWALGAAGVAAATGGGIPKEMLEDALPGMLFLVFCFWQLFPLMLASQGAYLDLRRLLVFPVRTEELFVLEAVLRVTTALEVILLCAGLAAGLLLNPAVPLWGLAAVACFCVFNLLLATGLKSLLQRLFRKRGFRGAMIVIFFALIMAPPFAAMAVERGAGEWMGTLAILGDFGAAMPWVAAGRLAVGRFSWIAAISLAGWTGGGYLFARRQFARSLRTVDAGEEATSSRTATGWLDPLARWPSRLFPEPAGAIVEKDLRTLARSPRFRLLFIIATTFGMLLWLPQALENPEGWLARNYVTMATLYLILGLGEVLYLNVLGFERASVQQWFAAPVPFATVLRAKNAVGVIYMLVAIGVVSGSAAVLPIDAGWAEIGDALSAAAVFLTGVAAGGNLSSVYLPRPIDPSNAWSRNASKTQLLLPLAYPFLSVPLVMAYLARWATGYFWAYHAVLGLAFLAGLCAYAAATEVAVEAAEARREQIVAALSKQDGPIALNG